MGKESEDGGRTVFEIEEGVGYMLKELSVYPGENEVLVESVLHLYVLVSETYDDSHYLVSTGKIRAGLHHLKSCVTGPHISLLSAGQCTSQGSPAKKLERQICRRKSSVGRAVLNLGLRSHGRAGRAVACGGRYKW